MIYNIFYKIISYLGFYMFCKDETHVPQITGFKCIYCNKWKRFYKNKIGKYTRDDEFKILKEIKKELPNIKISELIFTKFKWNDKYFD